MIKLRYGKNTVTLIGPFIKVLINNQIIIEIRGTYVLGEYLSVC